MRLIHLTDPHLSNLDGLGFSNLRGKRWSGYISWNRNRRKKYLPEVLERLSGAVEAENADQILLTGDLVQLGMAQEIGQARRWLGELGSPEQVMLVPGNHDIYSRESEEIVRRSWAEYMFQGVDGLEMDFPVIRKLDGITLIGLSTACVTPVFMASGRVGERQLTRLAELLEQAEREQQFACLLIHHPPLPGMTNWRKALADSKALKSVLEPHPPLLIFHGHLHHNREQQWGHSRIYCTAAASSISDASYRVIDIEDRGGHRVFRTVLKSLAIEPGGDLRFVTVDEQSWQANK